MLARAIVTETEDGDVAVDYVRVDVARAPKRNWPSQPTPAREIDLRDTLWQGLASRGLNPDEIAITCVRAARSSRQIRRRLRQLEAKDRRAEAEAG